jgi:membrane-bound lytic murein transglycosylase D
MLRAKPTFLLLLALLCAPRARGETEPFPLPPSLEDQVRFWTRIYSEVDTQGGLIHDAREMGVVYEKIQLRGGASARARDHEVEAAKDRYDAILRALASGKRTGLDAEEQRVLALFPEGVSNETLQAARQRIRFQLGQADKFRAGVIRSGRWEPHIMSALAEHGVPYELAALPHVESSYNPAAHSHAGAAGLWQFTRSTGRLFMRVDHVIDERLDPYISSVAAARLLLSNYRRTGTWPTAITAYNHGTGGMERAIRQLGTRDIGAIVHNYQSRSFGFASRNFYTEFLAAVEVSRNAEQYFGVLERDPAEDLEVVPLDSYYAAATLARVFGVGEATLREHNRALLSPVWSGQKYVPQGYVLRLPRRPDVPDPSVLLAEAPASERILRQSLDRTYRVHQGDTLSGIARRYGVSVDELVALNGLRSRNSIRVGQKLNLPTDEGPTTVAMVRDHDPDARRQLERPADGRYVVHRGDTLTGIATTFGLTAEELVAANDLRNRNQISVGQTLYIPGGVGPKGGSYQVQHGDTLETIAERHGISPRALQDANGIVNRNRIQVGQTLTIPGAELSKPAEDVRYVVRRGDTLAKVASRHGVAPADIARASSLRDRNRLHVGQVLVIPGGTGAAPEPAAAPVAPQTPAEPAVQAPEEAPALASAQPPAAPEAAPAQPAQPAPAAQKPQRVARKVDPAPPAADEPAAAAPTRLAPASTATLPGPAALAAGDLPWSPDRYAVDPDGSIVVHPEETLGHYAEWLEVPTQRLRQLNGLAYQKPLSIGRRVRLDFSRVDRTGFEGRRIAHHRSLQTAFFDAFSVSGTDEHVLRRGETLWKLSRGRYEVPVWLIQQYNPEIDVNALRPGMRIRIPVVAPRKSEA